MTNAFIGGVQAALTGTQVQAALSGERLMTGRCLSSPLFLSCPTLVSLFC